jgi:hypothetical protein
MSDQEIREALNEHWTASNSGDFATERVINLEDAVLDYPQSRERLLSLSTTKHHRVPMTRADARNSGAPNHASTHIDASSRFWQCSVQHSNIERKFQMDGTNELKETTRVTAPVASSTLSVNVFTAPGKVLWSGHSARPFPGRSGDRDAQDGERHADVFHSPSGAASPPVVSGASAH